MPRKDKSSGKTVFSFKELKFFREYLRDLDVRSAADRAGIPLSSAKKLMKDPEGLDVLRREFKKRQDRTAITVDKTLNEFAKLAFSDITQVIEMGKHGDIRVKDLGKLKPEATAAIAEISEGKFGIKIKLHDKKGALDSVARHLGMFNDKLKLETDKPLIQIIKDGGIEND